MSPAASPTSASQPGDRVVVLMANCPEVLITYNAIWRAGAVVTPVVFLVTAAELAHILVDSGAVAGGDHARAAAHRARRRRDRARSVRHVIVAGAATSRPRTDTGPRLRRLRRARAGRAAPARGAGRRRPRRADVHRRHHGPGQGCRAQPRNLWRTGRSAWEASHVPGANRVITPLPLSHAYGMIVTIIGMHVDEPGLAVIQRWFNAAEWIALCERHRCQRTALVPAMVQMLLAEPLEERRARLAALRHQRRRAARARRAPRVRAPRAVRRDPRGLRLHGERRR